MTEEIAKETITVDSVPHVIADMTADQQYYVTQLKDLNNKSINARIALDQITVASKAFTGALVESLKAPEDAEDADAEAIDAKKVN